MLIDWARVEELRSEIGEESFAEVIDLFTEEVETVVCRLVSGTGKSDCEADLHLLKGSAWNLGFTELGALCYDGQRISADGGQVCVDTGRIAEIYAASKQEFLAGLGQMRGPGSSAA